MVILQFPFEEAILDLWTEKDFSIYSPISIIGTFNRPQKIVRIIGVRIIEIRLYERIGKLKGKAYREWVKSVSLYEWKLKPFYSVNRSEEFLLFK